MKFIKVATLISLTAKDGRTEAITVSNYSSTKSASKSFITLEL